MNGLHAVITRPRWDGLAWKITRDYRTGIWMPHLYVADFRAALWYRRQFILECVNSTSLTIRSMMHARKHIMHKLPGDTMSYVLQKLNLD